MIDTLPTFNESVKAVAAEESTALHRIIYEYEPAGGQEDKDLFRLTLLAVVIEAQREALQWVEKQV